MTDESNKERPRPRPSDDKNDDASSDSFEDDVDLIVASALQHAESRRYYLPRTKMRRADQSILKSDMAFTRKQRTLFKEEVEFTNNTEFLQKFCTSKVPFEAIVGLIEGHEVFKSSGHGPTQGE